MLPENSDLNNQTAMSIQQLPKQRSFSYEKFKQDQTKQSSLNPDQKQLPHYQSFLETDDQLKIESIKTEFQNSHLSGNSQGKVSSNNQENASGSKKETKSMNIFENSKNDNNNIKVCVRLRPLNQNEKTNSNKSKCVQILNEKTILWEKDKSDSKQFSFDFIGDETLTQQQIFDTIAKPIVDSCIQGYNGSIFAYGQTGAGKTYTIQGPKIDEEAKLLIKLENNGQIQNFDQKDMKNETQIGGGTKGKKNNKYRRQLSESDSAPFLTNIYKENGGIIQKSFDYIFEYMDAQQKVVQSSGDGLELSFLIKCSYVELYNEQIIDLLQPSSQSLNVREDLEKGVYIEGLKEEVILSYKDMINLIVKGAKNRHVGETAMNKQSSRSHSLLTAKIESKSLSKTGVWNIKTSRFHIIDLAGSERQKDTNACGQQLKEAGMINKSLSALGNVINFLAVSKNNRQFIPYRSSQLTFILRDSLGGNSKTVIIANISPCGTNHSETLSTLEFAKRAKQIKNRAVVNEDSSGTILMLRQEIKKLKQDLTEKDKTYRILLEEKSASIIVEDPQEEENEKKVQNNQICKFCRINNLLDQHDISQPQINDSLLIDVETSEKDHLNLVTPIKNRISQSSEGQSNFDISKEKRPQKVWANLAERAQQAEKLLEKNIEILQKSQEQHNNEIQTQQEKLKQAMTAIMNLEQQAQREKMKLKLRENKIQKLETEHTLPTDEQIKGLKQEVDVLKNQLKAEKDEHSNPTITLLKVKITDLESQLKKTRETTGNSIIEQQVKEQTNMLHELKNYFQKQSMESIESKFTKYEKELKEFKDKLENQKAEHKDLQDQYDILIKQNVEASETNQKLTRDAAKNLLELQEVRSEFRSFQESSKSLQQQLTATQIQLEEKDLKTKSLSEKDNILEKLQETLSDQIEDFKKKTKEQEKEIREKMQIIEANKEEFKTKQKSIDQLKSILADKEQVLESRQTMSEHLEQQIKELEEQNQKDLKSHKDEIQKVKANELKIKEEIKNLKKKNNEQIQKLENDIEEQSNEIFNVKQQLDNEMENSKKIQQFNEQLQLKLDELKKQLEASKKALKDYQQANDNNLKVQELELNIQKLNSEKTYFQDEIKNLIKENKSLKDENTNLISQNEKAAGQQDDMLLGQIQKLKEDIRQIENIHEVKLEEIHIKNTQRLSEEKSILQETFNSKLDQLTIQIERLQAENEKLQGKIVVQDSKWKKNIPKQMEQQLNEKEIKINQLQQDYDQLQQQKEELNPILEIIQQRFSQQFKTLKDQIDQAKQLLSCPDLYIQNQIIDISIIDQGQNKKNLDLFQNLQSEIIQLKDQVKDNSVQITNKDTEIRKIKEDQATSQQKREQEKKDTELKLKEYQDQIKSLQDQIAIHQKEEEDKKQIQKKLLDSEDKIKFLNDSISQIQKQSEDDKKQNLLKIKDYENQLENQKKEKEQLIEQNQEKVIKINKLKQQKIDELDEQESKFQKQIFAIQCQLEQDQVQANILQKLEEICHDKIQKIQFRLIDLSKINNKEEQKNNLDQYELIVKSAKSQIKTNISLAIQDLAYDTPENEIQSNIITSVFQYINQILTNFVKLHEQQLLVQKKAAQVEFSRYKIKYEQVKSEMSSFQKQYEHVLQTMSQPNIDQLQAKVSNLEIINQQLLQDRNEQKQLQKSNDSSHQTSSHTQEQILVQEMKVQSQESEIDIHQSRFKQLDTQKNEQLKKLEKRIQELIDEMNLVNQNFSQASKENRELNKQLEESKILLEKAEQHLTESKRKQQQLNKLAEARRLESDDLQKNLQTVLAQYNIEKSRSEELEKTNEQIQSGQRTQQSKINFHIKVKEENNMLREQNMRLQDDNFKKNSLLIQASDKTNEISASLQGINNMLLQKQNIMNAVQQSGFQFRLKDNEIASLKMLGDLLEQLDLVISNLNHKITDSISERSGVVSAIPLSGIPPKPGNQLNLKTNLTMQKPMNLSMTYQNQFSGLKQKPTTSHGTLGFSGNKKKVEMSKSMLFDPRNKSKGNSQPRDSYQQLNNQKFIAQTLGSEFNSVKILASNTQASGTLIQRPIDFTGKKTSELIQSQINKVKISQIQYSPHENISGNSSNLSQKDECKESAMPLVKTRQQYKQAQSQKKVGFRQGKEME